MDLEMEMMRMAMSPAMSSATAAAAASEDEGDLRRGPWTVEEDMLLVDYIANHGEGRWNSLARCAGLRRTGKSCRLRWLNYLRPDVRRGNITADEQLLILDLHSRWGNRWSKIAQYLPGRTDNEIKNYWRTRVQKHAKQLRCDVNSKEFRDVVRHVWMPRLVERIQADAAAAGEVAAPAPVSAAATRSMSSPAGAMYLHHQQIPLAAGAMVVAPAVSSEAYHHHGCGGGGDTSCSEPSQAAVTMSPDDASSTLRSSSAAAENDTIHGDVLSGSWSELLATTTTTIAATAGLPDFDELGDFEDNLWSLEDIWLHQQC